MEVKTPQFDGRRRRGNQLLKMSIDDNVIYATTDVWFQKNDIGCLHVKSKAWNYILNKAIAMISAKIAAYYGIEQKNVKYSRKCHCSCGCSPGFNIVLPDTHPHQRHSAWAIIDTTEADVEAIESVCKSKVVAKKLEIDRANDYAKRNSENKS